MIRGNNFPSGSEKVTINGEKVKEKLWLRSWQPDGHIIRNEENFQSFHPTIEKYLRYNVGEQIKSGRSNKQNDCYRIKTLGYDYYISYKNSKTVIEKYSNCFYNNGLLPDTPPQNIIIETSYTTAWRFFSDKKTRKNYFLIGSALYNDKNYLGTTLSPSSDTICYISNNFIFAINHTTKQLSKYSMDATTTPITLQKIEDVIELKNFQSNSLVGYVPGENCDFLFYNTSTTNSTYYNVCLKIEETGNITKYYCDTPMGAFSKYTTKRTKTVYYDNNDLYMIAIEFKDNKELSTNYNIVTYKFNQNLSEWEKIKTLQNTEESILPTLWVNACNNDFICLIEKIIKPLEYNRLPSIQFKITERYNEETPFYSQPYYYNYDVHYWCSSGSMELIHFDTTGHANGETTVIIEIEKYQFDGISLVDGYVTLSPIYIHSVETISDSYFTISF